MKTSDYIVEYIINKGITDVFGYPGGMVTHLMDSLNKYKNQISTHLAYHEQGAAMAACAYAEIKGVPGIAYATSGPGATNLITGIANAYMDSIPVIFITGQVNSYEQKGAFNIRQRGFQETDIVSIVKPITKYATKVNDSSKIKYYLDKAFSIAMEGRKGPVLLDIAMDVTKADICIDHLEGFSFEEESFSFEVKKLIPILQNAKRPVILLGNGVKRDMENSWKEKINSLGIPVVSSMIAVDLQDRLKSYYGFIGAYGDRVANFIIAKSDLVVSIGSRLDVRQVGAIRENFAPNSIIIRVDIDKNELEYKVHKDDISILADANEFLASILNVWPEVNYSSWINICNKIKQSLYGYDDRKINKIIRALGDYIQEESIVTTDVGQNQVWIAQSLPVKSGCRILFSGGLGAMGYSLPASIGAAIASGGIVYCFTGDGGFQMNMQELQIIIREQLPIKIILINNNALGMIRHFQEMYFKGNYFQTTAKSGFTSPDFSKLADAYNIGYIRIEKEEDINLVRNVLTSFKPSFIEVVLTEDTYVFPKLEYGKPNQDQEPLLNRTLFREIMGLGDEENIVV